MADQHRAGEEAEPSADRAEDAGQPLGHQLRDPDQAAAAHQDDEPADDEVNDRDGEHPLAEAGELRRVVGAERDSRERLRSSDGRASHRGMSRRLHALSYRACSSMSMGVDDVPSRGAGRSVSTAGDLHRTARRARAARGHPRRALRGGRPGDRRSARRGVAPPRGWDLGRGRRAPRERGDRRHPDRRRRGRRARRRRGRRLGRDRGDG